MKAGAGATPGVRLVYLPRRPARAERGIHSDRREEPAWLRQRRWKRRRPHPGASWVRIPPPPHPARVAQGESAAVTRRMSQVRSLVRARAFGPRFGGGSSVGRERRVVAPEVACSNPVSHPHARRGQRHVQRAVTPPPSGRPGSAPGTRTPCPGSSPGRAPDSGFGGRWFVSAWARTAVCPSGQGPVCKRDTPVRVWLRPRVIR